MQQTTLIVPGFLGSGTAHWQTWLEGCLPGARRVRGIDWQSAVLARWAGEVRREIDESACAVWIVAHSFGCLASLVATVDRPEKVAGLLLVAPADPERFSPLGLLDEGGREGAESVAACLPQASLGIPSILVASSNDPWLSLKEAEGWAERWGSRFINLGPVGHINADSGFGPWSRGLDLLRALQEAQDDLPLGLIEEHSLSQRGRRGALARLRHRTRLNLEVRTGGADPV